MNLMNMAKRLAPGIFLLMFVLLTQPQVSLAQQKAAGGTGEATPAAKPSAEHTPTASGAIPLPPLRPSVDQLGQMQDDMSEPDKTGLFLVLFLQVLFLVMLVVALFMHWPLFGKSH